MSEPKETTDGIIDGLTSAEQEVLASAIKQVERTLLDRVVKKIRNWVIAATGVLTFFGIVTFVGIKATIVDESSKRLASNSEVKTQVIERVAKDLEEATKVLEKAESLATRLDTESARGAAAIVQELQQIHRMIDQVRLELEFNDSPSGRPQN